MIKVSKEDSGAHASEGDPNSSSVDSSQLFDKVEKPYKVKNVASMNIPPR